MTWIRKILLFWILIFFVSCAPATYDDLRCEGEAQTRKLAESLQAIETVEDLQKAVPRLRKKFNKIADLLCEVKYFSSIETQPSFASEQLFAELARLYEMPGGRELIETAQNQAVQRLQANLQ